MREPGFSFGEYHHRLSVIKLYTGLPLSGKKFLKMKNFPGQDKVRELHFQSGKFKKKWKSQGI